MKRNHFQKEETYLFSSLLEHIRGLSKKDVSITTKCLLAIFWRIYGERKSLEPLLEDLAKEIGAYNADPSRESNRTKKVFACAVYKAVVNKAEYEGKIQDYFSYARNSKEWLGQPRIACCLSFFKNDPIGEAAKSYLRENFGTWLSEGRDDFIALALLALRSEISRGDLQRTIEHVEARITNLSLDLVSLFLIGLSQINSDLPNKDALEDKLYQAIKDKDIPSCTDEEIISAATALFLSKYHKISGYFEKYSSELKETLALKDNFAGGAKKARARNLLLCIASIATIGLICLLFFLPSLVQFKDNPSAFGEFLLVLNTQKGWALLSAIVLTIYILLSYIKKGDPVFGIIEYAREKLPILKSMKEE